MSWGVIVIYSVVVLILSSFVVYLYDKINKVNLKIKLAIWKVQTGRDDFYSDLTDIKDLTD